MAYNGSGTFNRPVSDYVYDAVISETDMNTEMSGIATGLSNAICKDGQTTITANIPMNSKKLTGLTTGSAAGDSANLGQVQAEAYIWCGTAGGTKNALTLTPTPAITAYAAGQRFRFKAGSTASDDAVTVAVSGLTTKAMQMNGAAMSATIYMEANKYYEAYYTADGAFEVSKIGVFASIFAQTLMDDAAASNARTTLRLGTAATKNASADPRILGLETIWIPAGAMISRTTNGAASGTTESSTNKVMNKTLDFDTTTQEFAQFMVRFPKSWNLGTVTFAPYWTAASGSGGVVFGLAGGAFADSLALDTAFGTAVTSTDTLLTALDVHIGPTSGAITIANTPAAGDWVSFQVNRTVADGSDTLGVDAKLMGIALFFTTNAADDT